MPSIKDFIEAMQTTWPVALGIFLGSAAILGADALGVSYVSGLPQWVLGTAFIVSALSASILIVAVIRGLVDLIAGPFRRRRMRERQKRHIDDIEKLPRDEQYVLFWAASNNTQVFLAEFNNRLLLPLISKQYIIVHTGTHHIHEWPHHIPDYIWDYLRAQYLAAGSPMKLESPFSGY